MQLQRVVPVSGLLLALTVTSCTAGGGGSGVSPFSSSSTSNTRAFATSLQTSVARLASGHFEVRGTVNGQRFTGTGDETVANGRLTGLSAQGTVPFFGNVGVVVNRSLRYVKARPPLATAARPWIRVSADSRNPVIRQFDRIFDTALANGDLGRVADLGRAARSVRRVGPSSVDGTPATRYAVVVDPARLRNATAPAGTATIPVDLWLDSQNRPLRVHAARSVGGRAADVTVTFSRFDSPVSITAPPASQIAPG